MRNTLHKHLGFSREDIRENNRLIAKLACEKISEVDVVFVPIISPYIEDRAMARSMIGEKFVELYINCPLEDCIRRDPKGNYKKAISGKIDNFIGIADSNPYEPPLNPELEIKTNEYNLEHCVAVIVDYLNKSEI
ncbi:MAG: adenylyl-sulfate kinase [Cyanobacteriota bacterium]|nr:adenylyl-sulfate kinase [Cyanobacteriota bacterium]